jgi:hypothetical protein
MRLTDVKEMFLQMGEPSAGSLATGQAWRFPPIAAARPLSVKEF